MARTHDTHWANKLIAETVNKTRNGMTRTTTTTHINIGNVLLSARSGRPIEMLLLNLVIVSHSQDMGPWQGGYYPSTGTHLLSSGEHYYYRQCHSLLLPMTGTAFRPNSQTRGINTVPNSRPRSTLIYLSRSGRRKLKRNKTG